MSDASVSPSPLPVIQRVGRHTAIYGAGILFGKVISFIMLPFYTRFLTPADYGTMQLLEMTIEVVTIFAGSQIAGGIHRFYHKAESSEERYTVITTALTILAASYGTMALLTGLLAPWVSRLVLGTDNGTLLVRLAAANLGMQALIIVSFAVLRLREQSLLYTVITTIKLLVQLALNIYFLAVLKLGVLGVFLSTLVSGLLFGVPLVAYVLRGTPWRYSPPMARLLLRFGLPLVGTQVAAFFVTFGDRYFLRGMSDLTAVGLYALAYQFGFLLGTLGYQPFAMTWEPMRFEVAKNPDHNALCDRAFRLMNVLLFTVAVGIALFSGDFIRVMADPAYHSAASLVSIILVAYIAQSWASFFELGILVHERTEYLTLAMWLSVIVAAAGYVFLIPPWGGWGAAVATVLAFFTRLIVTFVVAQRLWPLRIHWSPVMRVVVLAVMIGLAAAALPLMTIPASVAARTALFALYVLLVLRSNVLTPGELERLRGLIAAGASRFGLRRAPPS